MAEVGKVSIGIEGDTSKLEKDVAAAKQKIDSSGAADAGEKAAAKAAAARAKEVEQLGVVGAKLKEVKKTYGEQIEVVQGLVGKLFAVGAIAGTFYKIGEAISTYVIDRLKSSTERLEEFRATLDKTNTAASQVKIADKFDELNKRLNDVNSQFRPLTNAILSIMPEIGGIVADDANKINEEIKGLNNIAQATANNVRRIRKAALDDEASKAAEQEAQKRVDEQKAASDRIRELNRTAALDVMSDEERIRAEANAKLDKLDEDRAKMTARQRVDQASEIALAQRNILAKRDKDIADLQAKQAEQQYKDAEEVRKWYDEQEKAARRVQESWSNAFRAIREENNRAFATDQAASMVQFAQQMKLEGMIATANMNRIVVEGVG